MATTFPSLPEGSADLVDNFRPFPIPLLAAATGAPVGMAADAFDCCVFMMISLGWTATAVTAQSPGAARPKGRDQALARIATLRSARKSSAKRGFSGRLCTENRPKLAVRRANSGSSVLASGTGNSTAAPRTSGTWWHLRASPQSTLKIETLTTNGVFRLVDNVGFLVTGSAEIGMPRMIENFGDGQRTQDASLFILDFDA